MTRKETTTIQVDLSTKNRMNDLKIGDESFNIIIVRLLNVYDLSFDLYGKEIGTKIIEGFK